MSTALDRMFESYLGRQATQADQLALYRLRDALPEAVRESPSVWIELILRHDHVVRLESAVKEAERVAGTAAGTAVQGATDRAVAELVGIMREAARAEMQRVAAAAETEKVKIAQAEASKRVAGVAVLAFLGGVIVALGVVSFASSMGWVNRPPLSPEDRARLDWSRSYDDPADRAAADWGVSRAGQLAKQFDDLNRQGGGIEALARCQRGEPVLQQNGATACRSAYWPIR